MSNTNERFDLWCLVELFGHTKIAGRCTEQNIAGTNMLRVDVPATSSQPSFTKFFGSSAIYSINPVDEYTAKYYAESLQRKPIESWDVKEMLKRNDQLRLGLQETEKTEELSDVDEDDEYLDF
jgi:hypothetical protein